MDHQSHTPQEKAGQGSNQHRPPPSKSELLSSAKLVAGAAKATLHHEQEKVDKGKVAGAAADLLGAASHYGKLEEKSYGKFLHKAEDYLHGYQSSHSSTTTTTSAAAHSASSTTSTGHDHVPSSGQSGGHGGKKKEGGFGDYLKLAEGLLKKQ